MIDFLEISIIRLKRKKKVHIIVNMHLPGVPGMALIQSETVRPQVFTAKCSEPQAIAVKREGRKWCSNPFERTNRNLI